MAIRYEQAEDKATAENFRCSSIANVAEQLGVSERQVARLVASRELKSVKIGRRRLIPNKAIAALMAEKAA